MDEEEEGIPLKEEHTSRTFLNKGPEWKVAEEGNHVKEEPVRMDEASVWNDSEEDSPWRVEHSLWYWHDGVEAWMGEVEDSLSLAGYTTVLECPCGSVPEPAVRVEYSLEVRGNSVALVIGRTLQAGGSSGLGNGSPEPWPASEHDRLELVAAWWNSWVGGRLV